MMRMDEADEALIRAIRDAKRKRQCRYSFGDLSEGEVEAVQRFCLTSDHALTGR